MKKPILADLHTHLHEKKLGVREWWAGAKKKKLRVIAITEHPYYNPHDSYLQLKASQPKNIILIPGIEVKTDAGDLLVYGTDETLYTIPELRTVDIPVEEALKAVKRAGLVASFPHPYGYEHDSVCEVIGPTKALHLIKKYGVGAEYYNGLLGSANETVFGRRWVGKFHGLLEFVERNRATKALRIIRKPIKTKTKLEVFAKEMLEKVRDGMLFAKKAPFVTAGSDGHYPKAFGCGVLELKKNPKNEKEFLSLITHNEIIRAGPNLYAKHPVDIVTRKEMLEGITYITKKKLFKRKKLRLPRTISRKIRLSKRIKTIKRISKTVRITKIGTKLKKKLGLGK